NFALSIALAHHTDARCRWRETLPTVGAMFEYPTLCVRQCRFVECPVKDEERRRRMVNGGKAGAFGMEVGKHRRIDPRQEPYGLLDEAIFNTAQLAQLLGACLRRRLKVKQATFDGCRLVAKDSL